MLVFFKLFNTHIFLSFPCHSLKFSSALVDSWLSLELFLDFDHCFFQMFFSVTILEQFEHVNIVSLNEAWLTSYRLKIRQGCVPNLLYSTKGLFPRNILNFYLIFHMSFVDPIVVLFTFQGPLVISCMNSSLTNLFNLSQHAWFTLLKATTASFSITIFATPQI